MVPTSYHIPRGIESVNGSSANDTGCGPKGCLLDGNIPSFNTEGPNWASKLVTVRRNSATDYIPFEHVVLTFSFGHSVTPLLVAVYLFLCPEWGIGAPYIALYGSNETDTAVEFSMANSDYIRLFNTLHCNSTCNSLTAVHLELEVGEPSYNTWHIIINGFVHQQGTSWVHVGEVSFNSTAPDSPYPQCVERPPGQLFCCSRMAPTHPLTNNETVLGTR